MNETHLADVNELHLCKEGKHKQEASHDDSCIDRHTTHCAIYHHGNYKLLVHIRRVNMTHLKLCVVISPNDFNDFKCITCFAKFYNKGTELKHVEKD